MIHLQCETQCLSVYENLDEKDVVEKAKNGDLEAQEYIIRKYMTYVKAKSRQYFLIGGSREDIIQEGLIGIFRAIKDYDYSKNDQFSCFVNLCITRQIITAIKRASRKKHGPLNSYVSFDQPLYSGEFSRRLIDTLEGHKTFDPAELVVINENILIIEEAMASLLSDFELRVIMKHLKGFSYKSIANMFECDEKSVDNALQRVKTKLKKHLYIVYDN